MSVAVVASISLNEGLIQKNVSFKNSLQWPIDKINSVDKTKCYSPYWKWLHHAASNKSFLVTTVSNQWVIKTIFTLISDLMHFLRTNLLVDGYCIVDLTWVDLYPREDWNFVLGESSCEDGCAVVSFGHFEPQSYQNRHLNNTASQSIAGVQCCKADKLFPQSLLKGMAIMMSFFTWNILQI